MEKNWKNPYAVKTDFDNYEERLVSVIDRRAKFVRRATGKPMARVKKMKATNDSHVVTRETHMRQAAEIAKIIAKELGLNETVAYIGMLAHDAGHPFGAHEGEETLNEIGLLINTGFFHHNAEGVEVVLNEGMIDKFIKAIPEAKNNKELRDKLKEEVWYFFDIIVGHDGEVAKKDLNTSIKKHKKYSSVREAVLDKVANSNRNNIHRCQVETLEGNIAKPADVIAYLKSDMEDAFREEIITRFSNEYLINIANLLFYDKTKDLPKQEKINVVKKYIRDIQIKKLREQELDVENEESKSIISQVKKILNKIEETGIDTFNYDKKDKKMLNTVNEVISNFIIKYKGEKSFEEEDQNFIEAEANKIIECTQKCLKMRNSIVEEVLDDMQEAMIQDYIENSKANMNKVMKEKIELKEDPNDTRSEDERIKEIRMEKMRNAMGFSKRVVDIIYETNGLRDLDYKEYVINTKRKYQTESLPSAVYKAVDYYSKLALKTGLIRDKFYDRSILAMIKDEKVKEAMKFENVNEDEYTKTKLKIGINGQRTIKGVKQNVRNFVGKIPCTLMQRKKYFQEYYNYVQRGGESFARAGEDVYYAIPVTTRKLIEKAIRTDYSANDFLKKEEIKKVIKIRKELQERFGEYGGIAITKENLENYIEEKIEYERTVNFKKNVAAKLAIRQLGGMNDLRISQILIEMGFLNPIRYRLEDKNDKRGSNSVKTLIEKTTGEKADDKEKKDEKIRHKLNKKQSPLLVIEDDKINEER